MSRPNWKLPLILSITLFVVGAGAYWLEFKKKPQQEEAEQVAKKPFDLKDQQIKSFKLFDGKQYFTLTCTELAAKTCKPGDNAKWLLAETGTQRGDDSNANALISALNNLSVNESLSLKDDPAEKRATLLKEYGLDSMALTSARRIEVATENSVTTLYLGQPHPVGDTIFGLLARDGKPDETVVYLVPAYFKANFEHDLTYWRDKRLFTIATHDVQRFELVSAKGRANGSKKEGRWNISAGKDEAPGDQEAIEALLSGVTFLSAKGFADKPAIAGQRPSASLTMFTGAADAAKPVTIDLFASRKLAAGRPEKVFATVSNLAPVFELEPQSAERFAKSFADLRLVKLITSMERFTAKRLKFAGPSLGGAELIVAQKDGKWVDLAGAQPEINPDRVQALLDRLGGNRIQEFLAGKAIPGGEAQGLTLWLWDDSDAAGKGPATREIRFWLNAGKLYARDLNPAIAKRGEAYRIDPVVSEALPWSRDSFTQATAPTPTPPADTVGGGGHGPHDGHGH